MKRIGFLSFGLWQPSAKSQTRAVCVEPGPIAACHERAEFRSIKTRKAAD